MFESWLNAGLAILCLWLAFSRSAWKREALYEGLAAENERKKAEITAEVIRRMRERRGV